ncbi:hypothetical protein [Auraticoccus monumenti]|uniref:hypothetical protein n=1 Tax=Auraticoccus monumenti TaxID=675864 RepID=UPI0012FB7CAE|nr:hypothetical protein [Auraticoccus monumenti]
MGGTLQLAPDALVFVPNRVERVLGWRAHRVERAGLRVVRAEPGPRGLVLEAGARRYRFGVVDSWWLHTTFLPDGGVGTD